MVSENGSKLSVVPKDHITLELCMAAVRQNGMNVFYVPDEYRTPELLMETVKQKPGVLYYRLVDTVPEEVWIEAATRDGALLECIPSHLKTIELCDAAVRSNPKAIKWIDNPTHEQCHIAVSANSKLIEYVPSKFKTQEMIDSLVPFIGIGEYIPHKFMTSAMKIKLKKFYKNVGFKTIGKFIVYPRICRDKCEHDVILETGQLTVMSGDCICKLLDIPRHMFCFRV